jgi:galactonate dehydratase
LREGLIDVVRPDIAHWGISGARRVAVLAEAYYVAIAPNHDGGPVATAAAIVPGGIETPRDGFLQVPTGPGLGIQVNESALEKYHAA